MASNQITKLEKEMLQDLPSLEYLDLSINRIKKIFNDTFLLTTRLHTIFLQVNFINYIEPNSFCTIKSLGILSLYVGYDGEIDLKRIGNPKYLEQLDLSENNINKINFEKMVYLRTLDLSSNNISDIDKNTTKSFPNLSFLNIGKNKFTHEIFNNIKSLKKLSTLKISNNFITSIMPSFLAEYENLSELDLSRNQIENVEFPLLKRLKYLYLRNNKLRIINEDSFSLLKEIKELNLDSNLISQIHSKAFFENKNLTTLSLANNFFSMKPDLQLSPRLTLLNLKNNSISYLTNYAFDTKRDIYYKLKIDLRKNNIIDLSTRTFCLSNLRISGFELLIDDINKVDKCILRQLDSRSSIQSNSKPGCEHILMVKHVNLQINGDISECKNFSFDINKVCYSDNKFKCPNQNKKRYTTWITGDPHLFSYKKNYELCSIGKDAVCFEHKEFQFLCSDTEVGNSNKQATVLTNLKFIYRVNNLVTFLHEFDSNSLKNKLNKNQSDIYENKILLEIIEIDNGIISIFIPNSNTHIFILKWETYYSVALRTTHETYWESKGLFYEGCRQPDDLKSQRKRQKTTNRNIECETECSSIEISVEDDNFPTELVKQICQFDCNEFGKNSTEMIRSMTKSVSTFVLSDKYTNLIDTPENIGRRNNENTFLNFGMIFTIANFFYLKIFFK
ncbi:unnamed protein product [Brachionus calyciflorus]|uniref:Uncharacterized protein n=1 Tax=Brachionus calyciflorus TaxID=104777 RepID=A0A813WL45_9BILA|nr:unnamed protein product [Brachionus calyciflorus]